MVWLLTFSQPHRSYHRERQRREGEGFRHIDQVVFAAFDELELFVSARMWWLCSVTDLDKQNSRFNE